MNVSTVRVSADDLRVWTKAIFESVGLPEADAALVTDALVSADLRGVDSHGVTRVPIYVKRLRLGLIEPRPSIRLAGDHGAVAVLDGGNGMGQVVASRAIEEAIRRASQHGVGLVGVRNSNHFGMAAYFAMQTLEHDMVGVALSNAPATMAPLGGARPYLGTNPLAIAVPAGDEPPIVLDMAMSTVARGKIILAAQEGVPIPEGWAVDSDGEPTTDPGKALEGMVEPMGGAKGYGLATMVEVLAGVLVGAAFGPHIGALYDNLTSPQRLGHLLAAIDVQRFDAADRFKERMDRLIQEIRAVPRARHVERIYLPGEIEWLTEQRRRQEGIELHQQTIRALEAVADDLEGTPFPWSRLGVSP
jgi:LDH2 family malate/lactate/ureidoglycolate dehydrogenase